MRWLGKLVIIVGSKVWYRHRGDLNFFPFEHAIFIQHVANVTEPSRSKKENLFLNSAGVVIVADILYKSASEQPNIPLVVIYEKAAFLTLKFFAENLL
jgi:hypothetical protein